MCCITFVGGEVKIVFLYSLQVLSLGMWRWWWWVSLVTGDSGGGFEDSVELYVSELYVIRVG